ncbi:MAG: hypothetical protein IIV74_03835, partial [Alphaproteobacteria bacterium]|nr:hypothetical protein [Alphaproteobacteria bacterium]
MKHKREDSMGRMRSFLGFFTGLALSFFVVDAFAAGYTCPSLPKYTSCNPGYYMTYNGNPDSTPKVGNKCTICPAGSYCNNDKKYLCPAGTYNGVIGQSTEDACIKCAQGSISETDGAIACTVCPAGQTTNGTGQTSCEVDCANKND